MPANQVLKVNGMLNAYPAEETRVFIDQNKSQGPTAKRKTTNRKNATNAVPTPKVSTNLFFN